MEIPIKAVVHKSKDGGYWAKVPVLPGCMTEGETVEELRDNLREAIECWLDVDVPVVIESDEDDDGPPEVLTL